MRARFALAAALLATVVSSAGGFNRVEMATGDTVLADFSTAYEYAEFPFSVARGSYVLFTVTSLSGPSLRPAVALFDSVYTTGADGASPIGMTPFSATSAYDSAPFNTGVYRFVVADTRGGVGAFKVTTRLFPQTKFLASGTSHGAQTVVVGAYPGFAASVSLKGKGPDPVTLTSVVGPDGAAVSFTPGGFKATALGDYTLQIDVPASVAKWSAVVAMKGKVPAGTTIDARRAANGLDRRTIQFPSSSTHPLATIVGEVGGPNESVLSSQGGVPLMTALHGGAGAGACLRSVPADGSADYLLYCQDGFSARIRNVVRYPDGPWKDLVRSFDADDVRSPKGGGTATLSDFTYDASGHPTGWTEVRRFDATGATHTLVFSGARYGKYEYDARGVIADECIGFTVVHTAPDGVPRTYVYGPFP